MKTFVIAALILLCAVSAKTSAQETSSTTATRRVVATSTTSATQKVSDGAVKAKPSKALRIFFESRNILARPEGYETLLTIEENGAVSFQFHTVSGRRDSILTKLKPKELQVLKKVLDFPKLLASEPAQRLVYADWMQSLTIEKDEKSKNIRFMVDVQKKTKENMDNYIKEQFGEEMTRNVWQFLQVIRTINDRFRF